MFNELIDKLTQFKELTVGKFRYDLEDLIKQLSKLEVRYNRYEEALKCIASYYYKDNYSLSLKQDFTREAKEALKTEEELQQEQLNKLLQVFKEVDRETVKLLKFIWANR